MSEAAPQGIVLVVDDEADIREIVRRALVPAGLTVVEAATGGEAVSMAREHRVDVVVLDLHLPDMSGLDVLRKLRQKDPLLHIIMLTAAGNEADRVLGLVSGADDYVVKPFSLKELTARVTVGCRRRETIRWSREEARHGSSSERAPEDVLERPEADGEAATVVVVDGCIVEISLSALAMIGVDDAAQVVGRSVFDFIAATSMGAAVARREQVERQRRVRPEMLTIVRADGAERLVQVETSIVMRHGRPASEITLWGDTDETSFVQEMVIGVRSEVADAVVVMDAELRIQSLNVAAQALYGWTEQEAVGKRSVDVIEWLHREGEGDEVRQAFARHGHWHGQVRHRRRDGSLIDVNATVTVLHDDAGARAGIVSVFRPVTTGRARPVPSHSPPTPSELGRAISRRELVVHYQPVLRLADRAPTAAEALVRWQHPERGLLQPAAFVDEAERTGAIIEIGQVVLDEACREWASWAQHGEHLEVAVNLSGAQLADPELLERLRSSMAAVGMPAGALWLEVTETSLVQDLEQAGDLLRQVAEMGVRISIDDFGTGWASLSYLREFPIHVLKVDRQFTQGAADRSRDAAIVNSIVRLAAELGLTSIAEGVETEAQLEALLDLGCDLAQGYLLGRPVPPEELPWARPR